MSEATNSPIYLNPNLPYDVKIPCPSVQSLLSKTNGTNKKIPNAFIVYRTSLHHELVSKGYKVPVTQLSAMASHVWNNELTKEVKQAYNNLVVDAKNILKNKSNTFVENVTDENQSFSQRDIGNQVTGVQYTEAKFNPIVDYSLTPPENPLFLDQFNNPYTFNNLVTTENVNNNLEIGNTFLTSVNQLNERMRILEEHQKILAERLGIQF